MPKIKSTELEKIIAEEIENVLLNEGFFDQIGAGLKGAVKGFGQQRSADKESEQIIRIAAEILSDPMRTGIDYTGDMESSRTPNLASLLGSSDKKATSKMSFVREEESQEELEEATSKEISFFTKKIKQALTNGQVTINGLKSEIQRLSNNDVVRAIPGVMEMFPREKPTDNAGVPTQQTPPEEEPTKVIPSQADLTQVNQTKVDAPSLDTSPTEIDGPPTAVDKPNVSQQISKEVENFTKGILPDIKNAYIEQADKLINKINNSGLGEQEAERLNQMIQQKLQQVGAFPV